MAQDRWSEIAAVAADTRGDQSLDATLCRLLHLLRVHVGMEVAWISQFTRAAQVLRYVDAEPGTPSPVPGTELPLNGSYCVHVLAGRMPALIPDARVEPLAALLPVSHELHIGSYLGVPLRDATGNIAGMVCTTSSHATPALDERDVASARLMAQMIEDFTVRAADERERARVRDELAAVISMLVDGKGRHPVWQPIVDVETGEVLALEGLTRFGDSGRNTAQWFDAAWSTGLGAELELAAGVDVLAAGMGEHAVPIAVNLSPATLIAGHLDRLLQGVDPHRVIVEVTEHAPVSDYDALHDALAGPRAAGVRLAVDDAGAGYSSLAHVVRLRPEIVKVDMALVRGVDADVARQALVAAMVVFGDSCGCQVVAEGVETPGERDMLRTLGIRYMQGYLLGCPSGEPPAARP